MFKIYIISDGTGRTAEQTLQAALTQFPGAIADIVLRGEVRSEARIGEIVAEAAENRGLIVHTLVSEQLREEMVRISRIHNVDSIDLMGPLLSRLSHYLSDSPTGQPGLFFSLNKEYFKRIDSMQFAFNHDDGQRDHEYDKAEIVLVGVSRTFKTPLSIYLAFKGWFVANYPVVMGIDLPESLMQLPSGKVFGLMTQPYDLSGLRQVRQHYLGGASGEYSSVDFIRRELNYSQNIFARFGWPVIQVTNKPIEEIASEILAIKRRLDKPECRNRKTNL